MPKALTLFDRIQRNIQPIIEEQQKKVDALMENQDYSVTEVAKELARSNGMIKIQYAVTVALLEDMKAKGI